MMSIYEQTRPKCLLGAESIVGEFIQPSESRLYLPKYVRPAGTPTELQSVKYGSLGALTEPVWVRDPEEIAQFFGEVRSNLSKINRSLGVEEYGGDEFEVAYVRSKSVDKKKHQTMLHISTYSSSISSNDGNAFELAVQAALYPEYDHVYVASPGNGGSTAIGASHAEIATQIGTMSQARYLRRTGRTTYENGDLVRSLPYLENMQHMLEKLRLEVTGFIGTDSAGGSYATGLAVGMPEDQISAGFFSERSNYMKLHRAKLAYDMLFTENIRHGKRMKELVLDGVSVVDPLSINAPRYDDPSKSNKSVASEQMTRSHDVAKIGITKSLGAMLLSLGALAQGDSLSTEDNPLIADVDAMLARHPNGSFNFTLAEHDPLYAGRASELAIEFLSNIAIQKANVRAVILPGLPHAYHTYLPLLQDAIRRQTLNTDS